MFNTMSHEEIRARIDAAICKNHSGKMAGFQSLSTAPHCNGRCKARAEHPHGRIAVSYDGGANVDIIDVEMICGSCYSFAMQKRYSALAAKLASNAELLANVELTAEDVPFINQAMFRFESFGDLLNARHAANLFTIAAENPHCTFTLWTKNPQFIREAIAAGAVKPANLIIILSSLFINVNALDVWNMKEDAPQKIDDFVDKVFTVYDKAHADAVTINCGGRKCAECRRCYRRENADAMMRDGVEIINELLK